MDFTANEFDKRNRIFCNRSLNMKQIKAIGFDLDYTLAMYKPETFETLAYCETIKKLIALGYPEEMLTWTFDWKYMIRGLVIDKLRGNILKIDRHRYVKVAFHGFKEISREERKQIYDAERVIIYEEPDFALIDTLFTLANAYLFCQVVDYKDAHPDKITKSYANIYKDITTCIDKSHKDGTIKQKVTLNPSLYLEKDPNLIETLVRLKNSGKKLFIVTNSLWEYTNTVMNYLTSNDDNTPSHDWLKYFDLIITGSNKPSFFVSHNPIYSVDYDSSLLKNIDFFDYKHKVYQGGNFRHLKEFLNIQTGSQILYVGDHIYGDILRSKKEIGWRTMLVVIELERELEILYRNFEDMKRFDEIRQLKESLDEQIEQLQKMLDSVDKSENNDAHFTHMDHIKTILLKQTDQRDSAREVLRNHISNIHKKYHSIWGQLMKTGFQNSRFSAQVENYACLYTSKLTNLRFYSSDHNFQGHRDFLPHDFL